MTLGSHSWIFVALVIAAPALAAPDESAAPVSHLHLKNRDVYLGDLVDIDEPDMLRWQSALSDQPLDFPVAEINAVYRRIGEPTAQTAPYCLELLGGDILYGDLVALTPEKITLKTEMFGEVAAPIQRVARLIRCQEGRDLIYSGPTGMEDWELTESSSPWKDDGGELRVEEVGGISRKFKLPQQFCLELSLVVQDGACFYLELGDLFTLETFGDKLALVRETSKAADVVKLQSIPAGESRLQLLAFVDSAEGTVTISTLIGKVLGTVRLAADSPVEESTLTLKNYNKPLCLEQLRLRVWNGVLSSELAGDGAVVHSSSGESRAAKTVRLDSEAGQLVITNGQDATESLPWDGIAAITFPTAAKKSEATSRLNLRNGVRVSGDLRAVKEGALQLHVANVDATLNVPIDQIDSLIGISDEKATATNDYPVLEAEDELSHGDLVDTPDGGDPNCLYWKPSGSLTIASLRPDLSARIRFRAALPQPKTDAANRTTTSGITASDRFRMAYGFAPTDSKNVSGANEGEVLTLVSGDSFVCRVQSIDENFVTFVSQLVEVKRVPRELVLGWHTSIATNLDTLNDDKRDRLLTLPRRQRDDPPTHMIESNRGDFLRGRLLGMNETSVIMEVRLEEKKIDRSVVRRIVWLGENGEDPESDINNLLPQNSNAPLVQAVHLDGFRLTFASRGVVQGAINGECVSLGACQINLEDVYQLLLGKRIGEAAAELAEAWKLKDATDPLFAQDDGGGGGANPGNSSSLVGNPAPDFTLDLLDGEDKFTLSKQQGSVVVLDFWATWCGPCIQAMPQIDGVVKEFEDQGVKLIGVNMQEDRQSIKSLLERIKLSPTVVLDIDGATAEKYQVTAIPQTVIIDRQGKVANLFVGGGPQFAGQLREALKKVVEAPAEPAAEEAEEIKEEAPAEEAAAEK
ncbi:TlpA family protein disulfide reductase [Blastopirellula marina]|uniref:Thioredoxin domain-containing protein n=1 Tax=Blastopirellula marina TaxID=124 RepID=A0A2S8FA84_9BACT|nr:TlpA disulfide reductase family protein [Blastopirellula marina]PQO29067.1 hypothetical protein C5Y98_22950 [Blastopirellula marina]PTL42338.1 TlpA family protein disulfide reductase [Blastopirellula marina]